MSASPTPTSSPDLSSLLATFEKYYERWTEAFIPKSSWSTYTKPAPHFIDHRRLLRQIQDLLRCGGLLQVGTSRRSGITTMLVMTILSLPRFSIDFPVVYVANSRERASSLFSSILDRIFPEDSVHKRELQERIKFVAAGPTASWSSLCRDMSPVGTDRRLCIIDPCGYCRDTLSLIDLWFDQSRARDVSLIFLRSLGSALSESDLDPAFRCHYAFSRLARCWDSVRRELYPEFRDPNRLRKHAMNSLLLRDKYGGGGRAWHALTCIHYAVMARHTIDDDDFAVDCRTGLVDLGVSSLRVVPFRDRTGYKSVVAATYIDGVKREMADDEVMIRSHHQGDDAEMERLCRRMWTAEELNRGWIDYRHDQGHSDMDFSCGHTVGARTDHRGNIVVLKHEDLLTRGEHFAYGGFVPLLVAHRSRRTVVLLPVPTPAPAASSSSSTCDGDDDMSSAPPLPES